MFILRRQLLVALAAGALPRARAAARPVLPDLLLPSLYDERIDPARYLVSEKYDGVRALWDGTTLRFRSGRAVPAPAWFTARLPKQPLDGELWLGRARFDELSAIVRKDEPHDDDWKQVHYMVFELPGAAGRFDERARALAGVVRQAGWAQLVAAPQTPVADRASLNRRLAQTVALGGEGLVLHQADAPYVTGRSEVLLKLKPEQDTEATVVGFRPGRGKYAGQVGALELRAPDGRRFFVGSGLSDGLRLQPPPVGTVITYRYRDVTPTGLPRFASFLRVHDAL